MSTAHCSAAHFRASGAAARCIGLKSKKQQLI